IDPDIERRSDRVGRDVIVRGAYSTRGEHVRVRLTERTEGADDDLVHVGHDPDLLQVDPDGGEPSGEVVGVRVTGSAGEDLVPDDEHGGGGIGHAHSVPCTPATRTQPGRAPSTQAPPSTPSPSQQPEPLPAARAPGVYQGSWTALFERGSRAWHRYRG